MTMRAAIVNAAGVAARVVICGPNFDPGDGFALVELPDDSPVAPGWTWDGAAWADPHQQIAALKASLQELTAFVLINTPPPPSGG